MARIKDSSVEAVKQTASIVDVISLRTPLRKVGGRYTGRCPFHEERTPSFSVNAEKGVYYCFGCGASGDTIKFVRETEQLDFVGAVEFLAERFNVALEYDESSPQADADRKRRDRLYALLEQATSFYERYLWDSEAGAPARGYLTGRGLGEEACREFRLGLAPLAPALARKAQEKGFTGAELAAAGLVGRRGNDYFSGRLLFPLADARGRVVGFQARKLRDDDPLKAKYVNTPEGELFHKGAILYGLDRSRAAIAKEDRALVVEGNTDVIALRQAGLGPVVASMGTALTERQLKELGRLTRTLYLCFDGDAAGEAATLRGMELAASQGFEVKVVALPPGLDPADAPETFEAKLVEAEPYLGYRVRIEVERALPNRQEAFVRAREILERFDDSPDFQDALRYLADRLDLPKETQAGLAPRRQSRGAAPAAVSPRLLEAGERLERDALAGCIAHPGLIRVLAELGPEHFDAEPARRLRDHLVAGTPPPDDLVPLYAELDARAASSGIDEETAEQLLLRLRERRLERELQTADAEHLRDLQIALQKVRTAFRELRLSVHAYRTPDERFAGLPGWPYEARYVEQDGLRMHYVDEGGGDPVLLLHGEPTWGFLYRKFVPALAAAQRVVLPDYFGFGRSDKPLDPGWYSYDSHYRSVERLVCDELDLSGLTVVVHDWGGPIGLRLAVEHESRVERLVLMSTGVGVGVPSEEWLRFRAMVRRVGTEIVPSRLVRASCATELADEVAAGYDAPFPAPEAKLGVVAFPELVPTEPDHPSAAAMLAVRDGLERWTKPALVLAADSDPIFSLRHGERTAALIPGAGPAETVHGAGHMLQEDKGEEIAARIAAWLASG